MWYSPQLEPSSSSPRLSSCRRFSSAAAGGGGGRLIASTSERTTPLVGEFVCVESNCVRLLSRKLCKCLVWNGEEETHTCTPAAAAAAAQILINLDELTAAAAAGLLDKNTREYTRRRNGRSFCMLP